MSQKQRALHRTNVGKLGEDIASSFLKRKGYRIISRNFKARYGEIDIIALDQDTIVFVEVKTRIGTHFGTPEEAITPRKLREITKTAEYYTFRTKQSDKALRIDAIGIILQENGTIYNINHLQNITGL